MQPTFKDNFSKQSDLYLRYRPLYPKALYTYLASLCKAHELVWDCGTGNGQAATDLAAFFDKVHASDPSEKQIKNAIPHPKVTYTQEKAEHCSLPDKSADLLCIANALHWFEFETFFKEARRVLKPGGVIAAWTYGTPVLRPDIDALVTHYHNEVLNGFWLPENKLVETNYATLPFPFNEITSPDFIYQRKTNLEDLIGLLNTWSATQRFIDKNKLNPTEKLFHELKAVWGDENHEETATWKLVLKVGRTDSGD